MAQLALLNPEVCGSSPVFGKKLNSMFTVTCIGKTKLKKKRSEMTHLKMSWFALPR